MAVGLNFHRGTGTADRPKPRGPSNYDLRRETGIPFDLLRVPLVGRFLKWRHSRSVLAIPLLILSIAMIFDGLFGPSFSPANLATVVTWIHFRGLLVLVLLIAGNFFCMACPFMLVRNIERHFIHPQFNWPRRLRTKWIAVALFALILFFYELFSLWSSPRLTAWIIVGYFLAVLLIDGLFKHATFCKYICPLGQFNFVASTVSPLEIKPIDLDICTACETRDCIRGRHDSQGNLVQRGCELALFLPLKEGNMDCTFCLDCVHACPYDNVGILGRAPASELAGDPRRSGIGFFSRRKDIAALVVVFCFGALMNAFGMVSPAFVLEDWISRIFHTSLRAPALGVIFALVLIVEPLILVGLAAVATRAWAGIQRSWYGVGIRYSYALIPLGFGMWLAHYGFHLLTGLYTIVPVTQSTLVHLGWPILGAPKWTLVGLPLSVVEPIEIGLVLLGWVGSLMVAWQMAEEDARQWPIRAFLPWAVVATLVAGASFWLLLQPMAMRATMTMAG